MTYKVGTRVKGMSDWGTVKEVRGDGKFKVDWDDGMEGVVWWCADELAVEGPVRTVTRREIVPGVYGHVEVADKLEPDSVIVRIGSYTPMTADELDAAARTLQQLAEALRDGA